MVPKTPNVVFGSPTSINMSARCALFTVAIVLATFALASDRVGSTFSIQSCVDKLNGPGDVCKVPAGLYRQVVTIRGKHGTPEKPIIISGTGHGQTIIDGTVDINTDSWTRFEGADEIVNGKLIEKPIYHVKIEQDIWQLFIDDEMMTNARWPNALWSDKTVFNGSYWAFPSKKTKKGNSHFSDVFKPSVYLHDFVYCYILRNTIPLKI